MAGVTPQNKPVGNRGAYTTLEVRLLKGQRWLARYEEALPGDRMVKSQVSLDQRGR